MEVKFFVPGIPATAGSKRGFPIRRKNGTIGVAMAPDNKRAKPWMAMVASAAQPHFEAPVQGGIKLGMRFVLPRPKGHFRTGRNAGVIRPNAPFSPTTKPDLTKLIRCAEDALKGIAWLDDSQVVVCQAVKDYGEAPGVHVSIEAL